MSKTMTYYLHVKDVMRDFPLALNYDTKRELALAYDRYSKDTDYEVLSMHSMQIDTNVIKPEELKKILSEAN